MAPAACRLRARRALGTPRTRAGTLEYRPGGLPEQFRRHRVLRSLRLSADDAAPALRDGEVHLQQECRAIEPPLRDALRHVRDVRSAIPGAQTAALGIVRFRTV